MKVCLAVILEMIGMFLQHSEAYPFLSRRDAMDYRSSSLGGDMNMLGVDIFVGPSCMGFGKGLFLACAERNKSIKVPACSKICKYAKGFFDMRVMGDKVIDYGMYNLDKKVMYKNEVSSLIKVLMQNDNNLLGHFVQADSTSGMPTEVRPVDSCLTTSFPFMHHDLMKFSIKSKYLHLCLISMIKFTRIQDIQK